MIGRKASLRGVLLALVIALGALAASPASAAAPQHLTGTLADGGSWVADVPEAWNGVLLLYSHGYGTLAPQDAPDPATAAALLDRGYALAGSSYDPNGSLWALRSAVPDQFETLAAVTSLLPVRPLHVLAFGTSMGGLVSALEAQQGRGRIDGALTTCGIVAGAIDLNNYQLDGEYAIAKLLAPSQQIQLVRFASQADGAGSGAALTAAAQQAQATPAGRARLALAMAFLNVATWAGGPKPDPNDADALEAQQFAVQFGPFPTTVFFQAGRQQIELSAGGNGAWTTHVDFARALRGSPYEREVETLYREAGLDLRADLRTLTAGADIAPDVPALVSLLRTSVPLGHLDVPELDLHTTSDQLVPVQQEDQYAGRVRAAGGARLLRQAYVDRVGHCNFTPAELVAGVEAVQTRVETGRWASLAEPQALEQAALALGLGDAAFVDFRPGRLTGDNLRALGR
jgi:hypothetical protein